MYLRLANEGSEAIKWLRILEKGAILDWIEPKFNKKQNNFKNT